MRKQFVFRILAVCTSLLILMVCLEVALRFLPVHGGTHRLPVGPDNPILRYEPNRVFTWSSGPTFHMVNTVRTNNYGFINVQDYVEDADTPLLAVIGDSYVEAFQVQFGETLPGRLAGRLENRARVYSYGVSGSALSQYLAYAEYAARRFHAGAEVINVIGNDFDESLLKYKQLPGYHYFAEAADGRLALERVDFAPSWTHALVRHFALGRYLFINLALSELPQLLEQRRESTTSQTPEYVANTLSDVEPERIADSQRAVRQFLAELPVRTGLRAADILFVLDGIRPNVYDETALEHARGSYYGVMRDYFTSEAQSRGFEVVDLQPRFVDHYRSHRGRFEFEQDYHWNSLGHQVAFEGVMSSRLLARFAEVH
jgi:hypothetical protein